MNPLKFNRLEKGLSQLELGIKAKVWQGRISAFENEILSPSPKERKRICRILGVPEDVLFPVTPKSRQDGNLNEKPFVESGQ
jgi:transcriptional regulator with XRE-family HTH domain